MKKLLIPLFFSMLNPLKSEPYFIKRTIDNVFAETGGTSLTVLDIDEDGDIDIITAQSEGFPTYSLLINDGNGNFVQNTLVDTFDYSFRVQTGDLNGDGYIDIMYDGYREFYWAENDGNLNFSEHEIANEDSGLGSAYVITPGNLDSQSNDLELVVGHSNGIWMYANDGNGNFTKHVLNTDGQITHGTYDIQIANVGGNGLNDIITADYDDDCIYWFENINGTDFDLHTAIDGLDYPLYVEADDLDDDGDIDVIVGSINSDEVVWGENNGSGTFTKHVLQYYVDGPTNIKVIDLDNDNDKDLLIAAHEGEVVFFENDGNENFEKIIIDIDVYFSPQWIGADDIDGDSNNEILVSGYRGYDIYIYEYYDLNNENMTPLITSIEDVPNDLGGRVYLSFQSSLLDQINNQENENYLIQRNDLINNDYQWVTVLTIPAIGEDSYICDVPTLLDSIGVNDELTEFQVISYSDIGTYQSETFFGHSINNLSSLSLISELPMEFSLHQNYPNPFNPVTTLRYDLPENGYVNITIYDMLGREVKTLINQTQDAGYKSVIWDATNDYGKPVSAGIYLYQIQAGEYMQTKKMVLLK